MFTPVLDDSEESDTTPAAGSSSSPSADDSPTAGGTEPSAPEGAPISCTMMLDCFPDPAIGSGAMTLLAQEYNWSCFAEGELDLSDNPVINTEMCQGLDASSKTFEQDASVGYDTTLVDDEPLVTGFTISTDASAVGDDQAVTKQDGADLAAAVFETATKTIWPDDADVRRQAMDAFGQVHAQCGAGDADQIDGAAVTMALGYEVRCFNVEKISVGVQGGNNVLSFSELIFIDATVGAEGQSTPDS